MKPFVRLWPLGAIMLTLNSGAWAQPLPHPYPIKPLRIITAAAGGGSDYATRLIATPLSAALGQPVMVDNRGLLATDVAAKSPADGYTVLLSGSTLCLLPYMRDSVGATVNDFRAITLATQTANILVVHPMLPAKSVKELISLCRAKPGQINYAISGIGNSVHIAGELFKSMSGIQVERINYKGASQALTELVSGQTQFMFAVPGSALPHMKSGRLRALAVTSATPTPFAPDLPPVAATLPGYESVSRLAVFAPAGTPTPIITRLNQEIVRILNTTEVKEKFFASETETVGSTPEALAATVHAESERLGKVIKAAGVRTH